MIKRANAYVSRYVFCREGQYLDATGGSFRAFMEGKLDQFPGISPLYPVSHIFFCRLEAQHCFLGFLALTMSSWEHVPCTPASLVLTNTSMVVQGIAQPGVVPGTPQMKPRPPACWPCVLPVLHCASFSCALALCNACASSCSRPLLSHLCGLDWSVLSV